MIDETLFKQYAEGSLQMRKLASRRSGSEYNMQHFLTLHIIVRETTKDEEEFNVSHITSQTDMAMPNVVRMLNEMQMKGYIKRRREGRNVYVSITDEGRAYHDHCKEISDGHIKELLDELKASDVTDEEINAYMTTALKLYQLCIKTFSKKNSKD